MKELRCNVCGRLLLKYVDDSKKPIQMKCPKCKTLVITKI